ASWQLARNTHDGFIALRFFDHARWIAKLEPLVCTRVRRLRKNESARPPIGRRNPTAIFRQLAADRQPIHPADLPGASRGFLAGDLDEPAFAGHRHHRNFVSDPATVATGEIVGRYFIAGRKQKVIRHVSFSVWEKHVLAAHLTVTFGTRLSFACDD